MANSQVVELVEQQTRKEEQERLLLTSKHSSINRQFSLWEVLQESIRLPQAQRTYFLVFLAMSVVPLIAIGVGKYVDYKQSLKALEQTQQQSLCESTVLNPWFDSVINGSLSATEQDHYYSQFQELCSFMYKTPPEMIGIYTFTNGTFTFDNSTGFARIDAASLRLDELVKFNATFTVPHLWEMWSRVVVAFGLVLAAAATTRSFRTVVHDISITCGPPVYNYTAKITSEVNAQFSMTVLEGMTRLYFTSVARWVFSQSWNLLVKEAIKVVNWSPYTTVQAVLIPKVVESQYFYLLNPFEVLFFISEPMAALEIGEWGFTTLYRSFKLTKGNRWKSVVLIELLMAYEFLCIAVFEYIQGKLLNTEIASTSSKSSKPGAEFVVDTLLTWSLLLVKGIPYCFAVSVFYIKCKAFVQKQASIA